MLQTIIVLSGPVECPVLVSRIQSCAPFVRIVPVSTLEDLLVIPRDVLLNARLIGFATPVIVPGMVLDALGHGAYNFHPGPPSLPGLCPAHVAVYRGERRFGVTAHKMVARVDAGPIVDVSLFDIEPGISVHELEKLSYRELALLFWKLSPQLATQPAPLDELPIGWSGEKSNRLLLAEWSAVPLDVSAEELDRRVAAFGIGPFGSTLSVTIHGHRFLLEQTVEPIAEPAEARAAAG